MVLDGVPIYIPIIFFEHQISKSSWGQGFRRFFTKFEGHNIITCIKTQQNYSVRAWKSAAYITKGKVLVPKQWELSGDVWYLDWKIYINWWTFNNLPLTKQPLGWFSQLKFETLDIASSALTMKCDEHSEFPKLIVLPQNKTKLTKK